MARARTRSLRRAGLVALAWVLVFTLVPAGSFAALPGGYYPVRVSPDVPGSFAGPVGMSVAPSGDVYIADTSNSRIKRMSSAGVVLGVWGSRGTGAGQFKEPEGVVVLSSGRVVVSDTGNNRLQLFEADGTHVATWGGPGTGNGQFSAPAGLAVDASDNVFVADADNGRVQKLSSTGAHLANIGTFGPGNGQLDNPRGVAVDGSGFVYVADTNNRRIQKFTSLGAYSTQWGIQDYSGTSYSRYSTPYGIALDTTGNLLVVDVGGIKDAPNNPASTWYYVERCSTTNGTIVSKWGPGPAGTAPGQYTGPRGVAKRPGGGAYVADSGNNRIQVLSSTGSVDAVWSGRGSAPGLLDSPQGVAIDTSDNAYVADTVNDRVQVFDPSGAYLSAWGSTGAGAGALNDPTDLAIDGAGMVWVVEKANNRVQSFSSVGTPGTIVGSGSLVAPEGLAVDGAGNIFVADTGAARVRKFSSAGTLLMTVTGSGASLLYQPTDVALDASGNLYVTDRQTSKVQVFDSTGSPVRTIGSYGTNDVQFVQPAGIAVSGSSLFVVDSGNARVQRLTLTGTLESKFGAFGGGLGDMAWPSRGALDSLGRFVVAERDNHRLQVWAYDGTAPATAISGFVNNGWYTSPVTVTLTPSDAGSGVATTYYRIGAGANTVYTTPFTISADGQYQIRYWSVDRMGNTESERIARVNIDSTGPAGTFALAGGAAYVASTTVPATLSYTDAVDMRFDSGSGYGAWETYASTRSFVFAGEGTRTVTAQLRDALGNPTTASDSVFVDLTAPVSQAHGLSGVWSDAPVTVTLTATDAGSGVSGIYRRVGAGAPALYTVPFQIATEGENDLAFWAVDALGWTEPENSAVVRVDLTDPSTEASVAPPGWSNAAVTVSLAATDTLSGVETTFYRIGAGAPATYTAPFQVADEGATPVSFWSVDVAGNVETAGEVTAFVDTVPPAGTMALGAGAASVATVTTTLDSVVPDAVDMRVDAGGGFGDWFAYAATVPVTLAGGGEQTATAEYRDRAGNILSLEDGIYVDLESPVTTADGIPSSWTRGPVTVTLSAIDNDTETPVTYYRIASGAVTTYTAPFELAEEGQTSLAFWSVDLLGNVEAKQHAVVRIDDTPPVTHSSGVPSDWTTGAVTVSLEATDALAGVASTRYRVGGSAPATYTAPFEVAGDGETAVEYWSVDAAGNVETPTVETVVIDYVPAPPATSAVGASGRDWADIGWAASAETDADEYRLWRRPAGGQWVLAATVAHPATGYRDTGLTPGQAYEYRLTVTDARGSESGPSGVTGLVAGVADERVSGPDRYATSVAVSSASFESAATVVIATGESYADALGASALAGALEAPVLITRHDVLSPAVLAEIGRLGATRAVIVGGERAIEPGVAEELAASVETTRIAGADRYETAALVAAETLRVRPGTPLPLHAFVVRGDAFPDALAVAPVAYATRVPVLLVRPGSVPTATAAALDAGAYARAIVAGGTSAVTPSTAAALGIDVTRIEGTDRFATAASFATWATDAGLASAARVGIATGRAFPDALSGGAALGAEGGVVLLVEPAALPATTDAWLAAHEGVIERVTVLGGESAVSSGVLEQIRATLR